MELPFAAGFEYSIMFRPYSIGFKYSINIMEPGAAGVSMLGKRWSRGRGSGSGIREAAGTPGLNGKITGLQWTERLGPAKIKKPKDGGHPGGFHGYAAQRPG